MRSFAKSIAAAGSVAALVAVLALPRIGAAAPADTSARLKELYDEGRDAK
jgi:hypothetical protein